MESQNTKTEGEMPHSLHGLAKEILQQIKLAKEKQSFVVGASDKLGGSIPMPVNEGSDKQQGLSIVSQLQTAVSELKSLNGCMLAENQRLESIIG